MQRPARPPFFSLFVQSLRNLQRVRICLNHAVDARSALVDRRDPLQIFLRDRMRAKFSGLHPLLQFPIVISSNSNAGTSAASATAAFPRGAANTGCKTGPAAAATPPSKPACKNRRRPGASASRFPLAPSLDFAAPIPERQYRFSSLFSFQFPDLSPSNEEHK